MLTLAEFITHPAVQRLKPGAFRVVVSMAANPQLPERFSLQQLARELRLPRRTVQLSAGAMLSCQALVYVGDKESKRRGYARGELFCLTAQPVRQPNAMPAAGDTTGMERYPVRSPRD